MNTILSMLAARLSEPSTYIALAGLIPVAAGWEGVIAPASALLAAVAAHLLAKAMTPDPETK